MSKTGMWAVIVLIVVLAAGALWYAMQSAPAAQPVSSVSDTSNAAPSPANDTSQTPPTPAEPSADTSASAGATSNASLDAGLQQIDTQMQDAGTAGASASSFNDTPVQQTE